MPAAEICEDPLKAAALASMETRATSCIIIVDMDVEILKASIRKSLTSPLGLRALTESAAINNGTLVGRKR